MYAPLHRPEGSWLMSTLLLIRRVLHWSDVLHISQKAWTASLVAFLRKCSEVWCRMITCRNICMISVLHNCRFISFVWFGYVPFNKFMKCLLLSGNTIFTVPKGFGLTTSTCFMMIHDNLWTLRCHLQLWSTAKQLLQVKKCYFWKATLLVRHVKLLQDSSTRAQKMLMKVPGLFLKDRCGNPFVVHKAFWDKLVKWPEMGPYDCFAQRDFSNFLKGCAEDMPYVKGCAIPNDSEENYKLLKMRPQWIVWK